MKSQDSASPIRSSGPIEENIVQHTRTKLEAKRYAATTYAILQAVQEQRGATSLPDLPLPDWSLFAQADTKSLSPSIVG